jgi:hypothetical protein
VLNNRGMWNGATGQTRRQNTGFAPVARRGHDLGQPLPKRNGADGREDFWEPPRG